MAIELASFIQGDSIMTGTSAVDRFWDQFIDFISKNGVKTSSLRWYVQHAEQYIKDQP